ncbi:hypothetical protein C8R46DRAFT_898276, partial [Mycena filopes]
MSLFALRARLAALDGSIARHKTALKELEKDRAGVETALKVFRYPVLTIPPEITSEIFLHCLPEKLVPPSQADAPLVFLSVCRAWRAVAISVPALWTSLCVDVNEIPSSILLDEHRLPSILDVWFSRAPNSPLTLT